MLNKEEIEMLELIQNDLLSAIKRLKELGDDSELGFDLEGSHYIIKNIIKNHSLKLFISDLIENGISEEEIYSEINTLISEDVNIS